MNENHDKSNTIIIIICHTGTLYHENNKEELLQKSLNKSEEEKYNGTDYFYQPTASNQNYSINLKFQNWTVKKNIYDMTYMVAG